MTQHIEPLQTAKSAPEVRQKTTTKASKFTPSYWQEKVRRRAYQHDGQSVEVQELVAEIQHAGERRRVSLGTNDRQAAGRKAATFYKDLSSLGWSVALAKHFPGQARGQGNGTSATIGEFIAAAQDVATVKPSSFHGYLVSFRWLVSRAFGIKQDPSRYDPTKGNAKWIARINRVRLSKLTPALIDRTLKRFVNDAAGNPLELARAKRNAASLARQARSLFSRDILTSPALQTWNLKNPFEGVKIEGARPMKYHSTIDAGSLMASGRDELSEKQPELYKVLLLALGAGLRRAEIDSLQWQQIDEKNNTIRIETTAVFSPKTDESEGDVFVDPALIQQLLQYRPQATGLFVLESKTAPVTNAKRAAYRADATFTKLAAWLRGKGVLGQKPIHALRKEFGSILTAQAGIHAASRQLRHADISTTAAYYADHRIRATVQVGEMLRQAN